MPLYGGPCIGMYGREKFDLQAYVAGLSSGQKAIIQPNNETALFSAVDDAFAGTIKAILLADGTWGSFRLYNKALRAVTTLSTPVVLCPLNPRSGDLRKSPVKLGIEGQRNPNTCFKVGLEPAAYGDALSQGIIIGGFDMFGAYMNSNNSQCGIFESTVDCMLSDVRFHQCGNDKSSRMLEVRYGGSGFIAENCSSDDAYACPIAVISWDGSKKVTDVRRSGDTVTVTYVYDATRALAIGDTIALFGLDKDTCDEYNVAEATILPGGWVINGAASKFTISIPGISAPTVATFENELNWGMVKKKIYAQPTDGMIRNWNIINTGATAIPSNINELIGVQIGQPQFVTSEEGRWTLDSIWDHGASRPERMYMLKSHFVDILNCAGISSRASTDIRQADDCRIIRYARPFNGIGVHGKRNRLDLFWAKNLSCDAGGKFDGKAQDGVVTFSTELPTIDDIVISRYIITEGSDPQVTIGASQGYDKSIGGGTDNPPTLLALRDGIHKSSFGTLILLKDYYGTPTLDGLHIQATGTAVLGTLADGFDTNTTTGAETTLGMYNLEDFPNLEGTYADPTDFEGAPQTQKGMNQYRVPVYVFSNTFTGTPGDSVLSTTPEVNETGFPQAVAGTAPTIAVSGSIKGVQGSVWQQNLNSTEADIGVTLDFGNGDNEIFVYLRTNGTRTQGHKIGFRPGFITYYDAATGDRLFPSIPVPASLMLANGANYLRFTTILDKTVVYMNGMIFPGIAKSGMTGTQLALEWGVQANANLTVDFVGVISDYETEGGGTGGGPTEPVTAFFDDFNGTVNTQLPSHAPDIGVGWAVADVTTSSVALVGDGNARPNTDKNPNTAGDHIIYEMQPDTTNQTDSWELTIVIGKRADNSSNTWDFLVNCVDVNNGFCLRKRRNNLNWLYIASDTPGSVLVSASPQYDQQVGDIIKLAYNGTTHVYTLTVNGGGGFTYDDDDGGGGTNHTIGDKFYAGPGTKSDASNTSTINSNDRLASITLTYFPEATVPDEAAPVISYAEIVSKSNNTLAADVSATNDSNIYLAVHNETAQYTNDATGVGHIIAGESPTGAALTTIDSASAVTAGDLAELIATALEDLDGDGKAPPEVYVGIAAENTSDDEPVTFPTLFTVDLPAPVFDEDTFSPQNPVVGDYERIKYNDISLLDPDGLVLELFPDIENGAWVEKPYMTNGGYRAFLDPVTGVLSVDTQGNTDTLAGFNAWYPSTRAWQEGLAGVDYEINTPYVAYPKYPIVNSSGVRVPEGTTVLYSVKYNATTLAVHSGNPDVPATEVIVPADGLPEFGAIIGGTHLVSVTDQDGTELYADLLTFTIPS